MTFGQSLEKKEKRWVTNGARKLFRRVPKVGEETRGWWQNTSPVMDSSEGRDGGLCVWTDSKDCVSIWWLCWTNQDKCWEGGFHFFLYSLSLSLPPPLMCVWDRVSLYNPGFPQAHCIDQAGLELIETCLPLLGKQGIKGLCHHTWLLQHLDYNGCVLRRLCLQHFLLSSGSHFTACPFLHDVSWVLEGVG